MTIRIVKTVERPGGNNWALGRIIDVTNDYGSELIYSGYAIRLNVVDLAEIAQKEEYKKFETEFGRELPKPEIPVKKKYSRKRNKK